jgi:hypothetical protein
MDDYSLANTLRWTDNIVYFSISKGKGTNMYKTEDDHIRLYKNNNFTVFIDARYKIHQITYHLPVNSSADTVTKFANIFKEDGHTPVIEGTNVTITVPGINSVPYTNTTGTIKLTGVTVAYK